MGAIIDHVNQAKQQGVTLDEEFDLVFNPLPAAIVLHLPASIISSDGFEQRDERTVAIPRAGLIDAMASRSAGHHRSRKRHQQQRPEGGGCRGDQASLHAGSHSR